MRGLLAPVGVPLAGARDRLLHPARPTWVAVDLSANTTIAPGTAPTFSSWTQMIASTTADVHMVELVGGGVAGSGLNSAVLYEIATGGAGAETAIASGLLLYGCSGYTAGVAHKAVQFPAFIPKGSRLSVRATCATAGRGGDNTMLRTWRDLNGRSPTLVALTAAPNGTTCVGALTVSGTAYAEVTAATAQPLQGVVVTMGCNGSNNTLSVPSAEVTVGVGAAGAEVERGRIGFGVSGAEAMHLTNSIVWGYMPTGARVAVKVSTTSNTYDFHIFGIPYA